MVADWTWKKTSGWAMALVLAASLALTGCGGKDNNAEGTSSPTAGATTASPSPAASASTGAAATQQTVYPLKVTDATNTEVVFEKAPERIVTLVPSETESLFAVGAGSRIVGVDKWSDYPPEAKKIAQVGDLTTNVESVLALNPDVVFASSSLNKKPVEALRNLGVKVFAINPKSMEEAIQRIELYGKIMNMQEQSKKAADSMRSDIQKVKDLVKDAPKKRVYMEFNPGWTVGDGEFLSEMVELSGGINVGAGKKGWYEIDPEAIVKANPEVIIYSVGEGMGTLPDTIRSRAGFSTTDALKNNRMYGIDTNLTNRSGPRLTQGLLEIAKAVHPELVK
ncbi:ABC transporter substrate-binding protein [Paenibacillus sp. YN15]|uniref:ABC transporter substrate-binding protein n=1 Tax=Paenibacillus sp. YN15 TaxID=1742774 RepID=UPI000DCBD1BA|nr:ABC transporter substrate-binding protein [Paenibacillus sp. YN15]RAU97620.1 ABC transporter substrate-binding protein [Paenibacillus sp. YN15]